MPSAIRMSHILMQANAALVETLVKALREVGHAATVTSLPHFLGRPDSPDNPTIDEWLSAFDVFVRQCGVAEGERAVLLLDYLGGCAKEEALCYPDDVRRDFGALVSLLRRVFGPWQTVTSLYADFYSRMQSVGETLAEFSRTLIRLHQRIEGAAPTVAERQALAVLADGALKHQFVVGVRVEWVRDELRRLMLRSADIPFIVVREEALCLLCEAEASVVEMRPVEKLAPALSGPVGGSVSYVGDLEFSSIDTVVSDHVVVSDACDVDNMSIGDIVVRVGEVSLSGGGDAVVLGIDESECGVNPVLADHGILNLCGIDTVVSGVNQPVCGDSLAMTADELEVCACDSDSLVMTAGEFDVCACDSDRLVMTADEFDACACDSDRFVMTAREFDVCACDSDSLVMTAGDLVSDWAGDSSGAESVDDVVACSDDAVLPDVFRVGGWLSVVGLGVAQPGWVDWLVCADDSLRPEPPPMHAMCLYHSSLVAA